jgi:competence protein ComFC
MFLIKKVMHMCKLVIDLILPEEKIQFEMRPEFRYRETPAQKINTVLSYKNTEVKKLIHAFKYNKNYFALNICANFLAEKILEVSKNTDLANAILIPIPRSKTRLQKYGFDQCKLLCVEILKNPEIKNLKLKYESKILIHNKNYESQTKLSRKERFTNASKSFFIKNPEKILNQKIIIVDDVWTTGATLNDAEKLLKSYVSHIYKFTIAH